MRLLSLLITLLVVGWLIYSQMAGSGQPVDRDASRQAEARAAAVNAQVQDQFDRTSAIGIVAPQILSGRFGHEASPIGAAMLPFSVLFAPDSSVLMIGRDKTPLMGSLALMAHE